MAPDIEVLRFAKGQPLEVLDQTLLPWEERWLTLDSAEAVAEAIVSLRVRGAPLLGLVGAAGMALAARRDPSDAALSSAAAALRATRPTAVDLHTSIERSLSLALATIPEQRVETLERRTVEYLVQRRSEDLALGRFGAELLSGSVLTHCNTGALATTGIGTALGAIRCAWEQGRIERCYATETRPLLQGARLTMWELEKFGIPATLLPDSAAASLLASGLVSSVITGADRVAANGDTANKIGTYALALAAGEHGIPFFIAAPVSTIDPSKPSGGVIPIEYRKVDEVGGFGGQRWSPAGEAYNPAFDVTPARFITAIITEMGVLRPPYGPAIAALGEGR